MLSNKEKEIIHICYDLFTNKVYARSGPSWLKKDDIKEMQSFIDCLKTYDEELNIIIYLVQNAVIHGGWTKLFQNIVPTVGYIEYKILKRKN